MIDNPVRGRFNAWFFAALEGYMHGKYVGIKSRLLKDVPSVIVEIGPGSGPNLRYLPAGTRLIAIEMHIEKNLPDVRKNVSELTEE